MRIDDSIRRRPVAALLGFFLGLGLSLVPAFPSSGETVSGDAVFGVADAAAAPQLAATLLGPVVAGEEVRLGVSWTGDLPRTADVWIDLDSDGMRQETETLANGVVLTQAMTVVTGSIPEGFSEDAPTRLRVEVGQEGRGVEKAGGCSWSSEFVFSDNLDDRVNALAVLDDGNGPALYVGGNFRVAYGVPSTYIAKWDGSSWSTLGTGFDKAPGGFLPRVDSLAMFDDGNGPALYVGGLFDTVGGLTVNNIAKWDGSSWSALGIGVGGGIPNVQALAVFDDGGGPSLYVGGRFSTAGGLPLASLAKWDGTAWSGVGLVQGGGVLALAVLDDSSGEALYAGGSFGTIDGVTLNGVGRWDGADWSALSGPSGTGVDGNVYSFAVFDDGGGPALYVGGDYLTAGGVFTRHLARWDGTAFSPLPSELPLGTVLALAVFDDGGGPALYAGGTFTGAGLSTVNRVARFDGSNWSALSGPSVVGLDARNRALAVFDDGSGPALYAGGDFMTAGGVDVGHLARWDGSGWSALPGTPGEGVDDVIFAVATFDDGGGPELYAAGQFTGGGGVPVNRIARWDGAGWSPLGTGFDATVRALAVFDDGGGPALYAGGVFTTAGGLPASRIARWDGTSWSAVGTGFDAAVWALEVFDDGGGSALVAGGQFTSAGGVPANRIARWDGTSWSAVGTGLDDHVRALGVFDDGGGPALYAAGEFATAGGVPANRIAKWDGAAWSPLGSGIGGGILPSESVDALAVFDDGGGPALYAGGYFYFESVDAGLLSAIARWDGAQWSAVSGGLNGPPYALATFDLDGTPALYAGGLFGSAGGVSASSISRWDGTTWSALGSGIFGTVYALAVLDRSDRRSLFAGGDIWAAGGVGSGHIAEWNCPAPRDWGDAPDPSYPTLLASDGASHTLSAGFYLGAGVDSEADGQPDATATGDDSDGTNDDDGVVFASVLVPGLTANVDVTASQAGVLDAWIDFDGNASWADAGEKVFDGQALSAGVNSLSFTVPGSASTGATFVRFRLSSAGIADPTGSAADGEVEDYQLAIHQPSIVVTKTASPTTVPEPGGNVTFTVDVSNTGTASVSLTGLVDDIHGNLDGQGNCAMPQTLAVAASYSCAFTAAVSGNAGDTETDTVTATGTSVGIAVSAQDSATVTITDVASSIAVTKTASPTSVAEPGGSVTFTVLVENTSAVDTVSVASLVDDIHGNLDGQGNCTVPQSLAPAGTYTCNFTASVTGNAGDTETDTVTVAGTDDDGQPVSAQDSATVIITDVAPTATVTKTASPTTVEEPGGTVTFSVVIANMGTAESLSLTALTDDVHGDLNGQGDCGVTQTIAPQASYACSFTAMVSGNAGDTETDIVAATLSDDDGNTVTPSDAATVTITGTDWGDAPDPTYPTLLASNGARHTISAGFHLGVGIDADADGQSDAAATGDDGDGADDEDGVVFISALVPGLSASVDVTASQVGVLDAWIDFDRDGTWSLTEKIFDGEVLSAGINGLSFPVPGTAATGATFGRFRLTTTGVSDPTGPAADGEVEDVQLAIHEPSIAVTQTASPTTVAEPGGDVTFTVVVANTGTASVSLTSLVSDVHGDLNGRGTCAVPQTIMVLGSYSCAFTAAVGGNAGDTETNTVTASGTSAGFAVSDQDSATVDVSDVVPTATVTRTASPTSVDEPGGDVTFTVTVANSGTAESLSLIALVDDVHGDLNGQGDCTVPQSIAASVSYDCSFTATVSGSAGDSETGTLTATLSDDDGNTITPTDTSTVTVVGTDWGDALDPTYPTLLASNAARHAITAGFHLGASVDADSDGQPNGAATGDDDDGIDDEDGVVFASALVPGLSADVEVTVSQAGVLDAWIDFDRDGAWSASEKLLDGVVLSGGGNPLSFVVPETAATGATVARFRLTSAGIDEPTGPAPDGEVEDHAVTIHRPSLSVTTAAGPASRPEPGGTVWIRVTVRNTGTADVSLNGLESDVRGDLNGQGDCAVPTTIPTLGTFICTYPSDVSGNAGDSIIETVTATGSSVGIPVTAGSSVTVPITDVPSSLTVTKGHTPLSVSEPGGDVTFTVSVHNTSAVDSVTVSSLVDDVHGDLNGRGDCSVPMDLGSGATRSCTYTLAVNGNAGVDETSTVTASGTDDDGNPVSAQGAATVPITDVFPRAQVTTTASPNVLTEPGGPVTFTVDLLNQSAAESLALTSLVDDIDGTLDGRGSCAIPQTIAASGTYTCSFTTTVSGVAGDVPERTVTATLADDDGNAITPSDSAKVWISGTDRGDAPDPPFRTLQSRNGAKHSISAGFFLGSGVDSDDDGQPNAAASGDDDDGNDDDDGVEFTSTLVPGRTVGVEVTASEPGVLNAWVDFDGDGFWDAAFDGVALVAGVNDLSLAVPATAATGVTYARFRLTRTGIATPFGSAANGEVEDYRVMIERPSMAVSKSASPATVTEPGGDVTFTVAVTNTGTAPVDLASLVDGMHGDLNGQGDCSLPQVVGVGATSSCSYVATVSGNGAGTETGTVTAVGTSAGLPLSASGSATVTIEDILPGSGSRLMASPTSVDEPGGDVTFTVEISNRSLVEPIVLTQLTSNLAGNLDGQGTCSLPQMIAGGGVWTCEFTATISGGGGDSQRMTVSGQVADDDGNTSSAGPVGTTVTITDVPSSVAVGLAASPASVDEPGGDVTWTVEVANTSVVDEVTITSLVDDVFGDLDGQGTCAVPQTLAASASFSCTYAAAVSGNAGDSASRTVTASGTDDDGGVVSAQGAATVTIEDVAPSATLSVTTSVGSVDEPGGDVDFTVEVTNTSTAEALELSGLASDLHGDLDGQGTCALPQSVAASGSYACSYTATVSGNAGDSETTTVTATASDDDGTSITPSGSATVMVAGTDWGDAPDPTYPTLEVSDGARHAIDAGFFLGTGVDADADGQPNGDASGDDADGTNDEDGVVFAAPLVAGTTVGVEVTASRAGLLDAWVDFDGDGTWSDPDERIFAVEALAAGPNDLSVSVPAAAATGATYARFRLSSSGVAAPTGHAVDGEVEDYAVSIERPSITVTKAASPTTVDEPGGPVTFTVAVTNTGTAPVDLASLVDDVHGDLNGQGDCMLPQVVGVGATRSCTYTAMVSGNAGDVETGAVTAGGTSAGVPVSAQDVATVTVTDVASSLAVALTAGPTSVDEPGGDVTWTLEVANTSVVDEVTITSLVDDVFGDLDGQGTCAVPQTLAASASFSCTYVAAVSGNAGDSPSRTVTASGTDDDGGAVSAQGAATVTIEDVAPSATLSVTASPTMVEEPGGDVGFTVEVSNASTAEALELMALISDLHGDLDGQGTCALPQTVAASGSYTCSYTVTVSGNAGDSETTTVTATASDDDGTSITPSGSATVTVAGTDWGDAPDPTYPTLEVSDGARHAIDAGFFLGTVVDADADGQPNGDASGDDADGTNDEDGVVFAAPLVAGTTVGVEVTASRAGLLDAWVDFDGDGTWSDPDERIFAVEALAAGPNDLSVSVPAAAATGATYARFRLSSSGVAAPTGHAVDGEVEDYAVSIERPSITVTKAPSPTTVDEPGGLVTFTVAVTNTGTAPVDLASLVDDVHGDLNGQGDCFLPQVVEVGTTSSCAYTAMVSGNAGDVETGAVTAGGMSAGVPVSAQGAATVAVTDVPPAASVALTASPTTVVEPGGDVSFTVEITNASTAESLALSGLSSDLHGDLDGQGTCTVPQNIAASGSYTCSYSVTVSGNAGSGVTTTVTATASDDDGSSIHPSGSATVTVQDAASSLAVALTASPTAMDEPGGDVTWTVEITNTSVADVVTVTSLVDDALGNLDGQGTCAVPQTLAASASYSCTYVAAVAGNAGDSASQRVTVSGTDDDDGAVSAQGAATVAIEDVAPSATLSVTASPTTVDEPGGDVDFTVEVTNTSTAEALELSGLASDLHGDLDGRGTCALPQSVAAGGSYACSYTATVSGNAGDSATTTVTATASDDDGTSITPSGSATVTVEGEDWGDALDPTYPTLLASNGARHTISPGFYLGSGVDAESDGQPAAAADGDDNDGGNDAVTDDEDGVIFTEPLAAGASVGVEVTASRSGRLDAWIDFDGDGSWSGPGEQIFVSEPLSEGRNDLTFLVPSGTPLADESVARFRLSTAGGLAATGPAPDGEVEDLIVVNDTVSPEVERFEAVPRTADGELTSCETTTRAPSALAVVFTEALQTGSGLAAADDPENYRLFGVGPNQAFDTAFCGPPELDDVRVPIQGVRYSTNEPIPFSRAELALEEPLPDGLYRMIVCGTLEDAQGHGLNAGADVVLSFRVDDGNLLTNGNFDCGLAPWLSDPALRVPVHDPLDHDGSPESGSVRFSSSSGGEELALGACTSESLVVGGEYRFGANLRVDAASDLGVTWLQTCTFYDGADCTGTSLGNQVGGLLVGETAGTFVSAEKPFELPDATRSLFCEQRFESPDPWDAFLDGAWLRTDALVIFSDGFESGDLSAWETP